MAASHWLHILEAHAHQSYASHLPGALPAQAEKWFLDQALNCTEWRQPTGPNGPIPCKTAWMVREGCSCEYSYGGLTVRPQPFSNWVEQLMEFCMPACGLLDRASWPDCVNLNLYEHGHHSVGWHADDEPLFGGSEENKLIISLSLGSTRSFELCGQGLYRRMELRGGDLMTMEGLTQQFFKHRVGKSSAIVGPRVNLTWRWIRQHRGSCASRCIPCHRSDQNSTHFSRAHTARGYHGYPLLWIAIVLTSPTIAVRALTTMLNFHACRPLESWSSVLTFVTSSSSAELKSPSIDMQGSQLQSRI